MEIGLLFHEVGIDRFLQVGLRVALHFASFHGISFSLLQAPPLILWFSLIELKGFGTNSTVDLSRQTHHPRIYNTTKTYLWGYPCVVKDPKCIPQPRQRTPCLRISNLWDNQCSNINSVINRSVYSILSTYNTSSRCANWLCTARNFPIGAANPIEWDTYST